MTYPTGEALIAAIVAGVSGFTTTTKRGDWSILNDGKAAACAIIRPGPFSQVGASGRMEVAWTTVVEIWQRYTTDGTSGTTLQANMMAVKAALDARNRLGDTGNTVQDANVRVGNDLVRIPPPPEGIKYLEWDLVIEWVEHVPTTFLD